MERFKITVLTTILAICCVFPATAAALQGDGDGSGDGSGGGGLALLSSSVTNGETEVEINRSLRFVFDSNVNNITIKEHNAKCFVVKDESGESVLFSVVQFDDQLNRDMRRDIHLDITGGLKEGKTYTVIISGRLLAKNGSALGKDHAITFTTEGNTDQTLPPSSSNGAPNAGSDDNGQMNSRNQSIEALDISTTDTANVGMNAEDKANGKVADDSVINDDIAISITSDNEGSQQGKPQRPVIWLVAAVFAALAVAAVFLWPSKNKRNPDNTQ